MNSWSDEYVHTNGIRIHYYRTGGAKPPLLLLHGVTDSGLCWTRVARALEGEYDVIMPDARGHGFSDGPETGFSIEILAEDVAGLIQALQLQQPYILGHSMGGLTASVLAAQHPDLPRAILLEDPAWRTSVATSPNNEADQPNSWLQWLLPVRAMPREERIAAQRARSHWVDEELGPWADAKDQFNLAIVERNDLDSKLHVTSWREYVPQISCPILLMTADVERGAVVTEQVAQEAGRLWRHGETVHIPDAGHNIRREQFEPFMAIITGFLREH
jgi:pimeloyl-ACP methyl ester carboxylesterase